MDEITKPDVCVFNAEASDLIVTWGRTAIEYEIATEKVVNLMTDTFRSRREMELAKNEIQYNLRSSLSEEDQLVLNTTEQFMGSRNQSPEQKTFVKKRTSIIARIRRLFKRLLDECFPSMIPMMAVAYAEPSPTKIDSTPTKTDSTPTKTDSSPDASSSKLEPSVGADLSESIGEICNGVDEVRQKLQKPMEEQATRPRFQKSSFDKPTEKDLFETPAEMLNTLTDILPVLAGKKIFEPCNGNGAITNYLKGNGIDVLARDKFTMEESHDFLKEPIPDDIDYIITNPPFVLKYEFLSKLSTWGKPFVLLLPVETLFTKKGFPLFQSIPFDMIIFNGASNFLHAGKIRQVAGCAWFLCRFPDANNKFVIKELGDAGDEELGSEDTEGDDDGDDDDEDFEG